MDKWRSLQSKQANNVYSAEIKNQMKGTLHLGAMVLTAEC